jgi:hypothetical protein
MAEPTQALPSNRSSLPRGREFRALRRLVTRLERAAIPYAVLGGLAVHFHGYHQATKDVDLLLSHTGLAELRRRLVPKAYESIPGKPRRFLDRRDQVMIDVQVTGFFPGRDGPGRIAFPDPSAVAQTIDRIQVADLKTLIALKLAAGRFRDFGDVGRLIRVHDLDESFLPTLHTSVRRDFRKCLEEQRRDDEFEAYQSAQMEALLRRLEELH